MCSRSATIGLEEYLRKVKSDGSVIEEGQTCRSTFNVSQSHIKFLVVAGNLLEMLSTPV